MDDSRRSGAARPVSAARLDPFAFPSDTDFRFAVPVSAVLGASLLLWQLILNQVPLFWDWKSAAQEQCRQVAVAAHPGDLPSLRPEVRLEIEMAWRAVYRPCTLPFDRAEAAALLGGVGAVIAGAVALYWAEPNRRIRRARLEPLRPDDAPELTAFLADLCREAGLAQAPTFLVDPFNPGTGGLAFGRRGSYYVALDGGLLTLFYNRKAAFSAVVLHELAHLRNGDVDKTYLTVNVWQAFVLVVLASVALTLLGKPLDRVVGIGWRLLVLAALVYLARNAVLRAREAYADARTAALAVRAGGLRQVLEGPAPSVSLRPGGRLGRLVERVLGLAAMRAARRAVTEHPLWRHPRARRLREVQELLETHPRPAVRRALLDDTRPLFHVATWETFGAGLALGLAFPQVAYLLRLLLGETGTLSLVGTGLVLAPLAAGVVAAAAWRAVFATQVAGRAPPFTDIAGRLALALTLGVVLGRHVSFTAYALERSAEAPSLARGLAFDVLWGGLLLAGTAVLLHWFVAGASTWLEVAAAGRSPRPTFVMGATLAGFLLAGWLALVFYMDVLRLQLPGWQLDAISATVTESLGFSVPPGLAFAGVMAAIVLLWLATSPLLAPALTALWAFPLAPWFWRGRRRPVALASWAYMDGTAPPSDGSGDPVVHEPPLRLGFATVVGARSRTVCPTTAIAPLRLGFATVVGAVAGAAFGVFAFLVCLVLAVAGAGNGVWLFYAPMLAMPVQGALAGIVAARVARLGALHGVCSAAVAGWVIAVAAVWLVRAFLGVMPPAMEWQLATPVLNGGVLLALPMAFGAAAWAGRQRRRHVVGQGIDV